MKNESAIERNVYYHHTDAGGVVYYAAFLAFLEEGRSAFCLERGLSLPHLSREGVGFPVVHFEADYRLPGRYGDALRITTRVERIGNSSLHFRQVITRGPEVLLEAKTVWACMGKDLAAQPVPDAIRRALEPDNA